MVTESQQPKDDSVYWEIVDHVESEMDFEADLLDIEVEEDSVAITGSVPSQQRFEELERLIFDTIGLENVEFDVIVDEALQSRGQKMGQDEPEGGEGLGTDPNSTGAADLNNSPRRQY